MRQIDPDLLEIGNDPFTGKRAPPEGKYDALFRRLRVGQCIKCEPKEAGPLSNALRLCTGMEHRRYRVWRSALG